MLLQKYTVIFLVATLIHNLTVNVFVSYMYRCVKVLHDPDGNMMMCSSDTDGPNSGLNIVDKDGYTALHLACLNGHDSVVKYLCTCNADLEAW